MDEIIKTLEKALADAKAGDLSHLVIIACANDGRTSVSVAGEIAAGMVHALLVHLAKGTRQDMFPSKS